MSNNNNVTPEAALVNLIKAFPTVMMIISAIVGVVFYLQKSFPSYQQYEQQQVQITTINSRLDSQYKEMKDMVDRRYDEAIKHSDDNRSRMEAVMGEIKDSIKTLILEQQYNRKR